MNSVKLKDAKWTYKNQYCIVYLNAYKKVNLKRFYDTNKKMATMWNDRCLN